MTASEAIGQISCMATPFREITIGSSDASLDGVTRPAGFLGAGPRPGAAASFSWHLVFVDITGKPVPGGSAYIRWFGVEVNGNAVLTTPLGAGESVPAGEARYIGASAGVWPWPVVSSMTPPAVDPKATQITIVDGGDGTYAIAVVGDDNSPYEFEAVDADLGEITNGLAALFVGHPDLTVNAAGEGYLLISGSTDYELVLESPGDSMSQNTYVDYTPPITKMQIYMAQSAVAAVDAVAAAAAAQTGAAAALQAANLSYSLVRSAASQAISSADLPSTSTMTAVVTAAVEAAAGGGGDLQKYGGDFAGVATEEELAVGNPGYVIEIMGWIATGGATALQVELRSGAANATNSSMAGAPAKFTIGAGSAVNLAPGSQPLWTTQADQGVVLKKSAGSLTCQTVVWYRLKPST